jgi:hypothetical protein
MSDREHKPGIRVEQFDRRKITVALPADAQAVACHRVEADAAGFRLINGETDDVFLVLTLIREGVQ